MIWTLIYHMPWAFVIGHGLPRPPEAGASLLIAVGHLVRTHSIPVLLAKTPLGDLARRRHNPYK